MGRRKAIAASAVAFVVALVVFGATATLSFGLIILGAAAAFLPYVMTLPPPMPRRPTGTLPPPLAKQQFHAVEAMRRAGMSEEWIRAFVTFEPEPTPAPKEPPVPGDNAALLAELKNAWESRAQSPLVPIRPACQIRVDNHITLWDVDGNIVGRWEV